MREKILIRSMKGIQAHIGSSSVAFLTGIVPSVDQQSAIFLDFFICLQRYSSSCRLMVRSSFMYRRISVSVVVVVALRLLSLLVLPVS